jgi:S1-C subfamily serine protease
MDRCRLLKWTMSLSLLAAGAFASGALRAGPVPNPAAARVTMAAPSVSGAWDGSVFATSAGTGFGIAPGLLVTDAHVILACTAEGQPIRVAGHPGPWDVVHEDPDTDLVLLRGPDRPEIPPMAVSAAPHIPRDTETLIVGFPVEAGAAPASRVMGSVRRATIMMHRPGTGQAESFRATDRLGRPVEPTWEDGAAFFGTGASDRMRWALEIAARIGHGASGGPVVDGTGSVIGVVVADGTGDGLISATTLNDLIEFLGAAGIVPRFSPPANAETTDWDHAYQRATPSVVRVGC